MKYTIDKQEKYSLLRLHEEKLDSSVAPNLKSELITLHAEGVKNIILDLSDIKYTDSSGLFVLACLSDHTMKLIKISQLDSVLNILPTVEEAVDAVFMHEIEKDLKGGAD
jgi:anti-sigma B factor antagonist